MNNVSDKAWGGRFTSQTDKQVEQINASLPFDHILFQEDIIGSAAHARMLHKIQVLSEDELSELLDALKLLLASFRHSPPDIDISKEDIHMYVESKLREIIGPLAGKVHTARSRNDQIALDMRLYCRNKILTLVELLNSVQKALLKVAEQHTTTLLPGYTHLQRAQPISLAFHLACYTEMFARDIERLKDGLSRVNILPLGAGALAGTTFNIDREFVARLLRFPTVYNNSMDAVSDRDYIVELLSAGSLIMIHLSRFCEECVMWSSREFGFIEFGDAFCTGSSIMPQKKNPDVAELLRGKTGRVTGALTSILMILKGLPLAYNKDLQEDKEGLFDSIKTLETCLAILPPMIESMKVNAQQMRLAVESDFSNATDLADYLVIKGIPFRDSHSIAGKLVRDCIDHGRTLLTTPLERFKDFSELIEEDIFETLNPETVVNRRESVGGTGKQSVAVQLDKIDNRIQETSAWHEATKKDLWIDETTLFQSPKCKD